MMCKIQQNALGGCGFEPRPKAPKGPRIRRLHPCLHATPLLELTSAPTGKKNLPIKPWGKDNKKFLQKLINEGKVDIRRTSDVRYIDRIRVKYFRERDVQNFRRNFRTYARSRELEDQISGYRRQQSEYCLFIFIIKLLLTPPTSPIL